MLITDPQISTVPLKCSGGRVLTECMLPSLSTAGPPDPHLSSLRLWFLEAELQAASSCSSPCPDASVPAPLAPPSQPLNRCPWGQPTQWMLKHTISTEPAQGAVSQETQALPPSPTSLPSCKPSLLCPHPRKPAWRPAPCFLGSNGFYYLSICCENLTSRELTLISYMQFIHISLPWQRQMS